MLSIDTKTEVERIISFLQSYFQGSGFSNAVIGLSGGVDSATSFALAVKALGKEHVYPVILPYGALGTQGVLDSMNLIQASEIPISNIVRIDIKNAVDEIARAGGAGFDNLRRGNITARVRMTILYDQAKRRQALVVGTENKSEHLLGYYTRYGDEASDIEPIVHLYKTQVYELAKCLGLPQNILDKPPSADLWMGQTDQGELGFSYSEADGILSLMYDDKINEEEILKKGHSKHLIEEVARRVKSNLYKKSTPAVLIETSRV